MKQILGLFIAGVLLSSIGATAFPTSNQTNVFQKELLNTVHSSFHIQQSLPFFMKKKLLLHTMQITPFLQEEFVFSPQPVTLKDDAFLGSDTLHYTEWWYFDAILEDDWSVQMIIQIITLFNQEVALAKINLYSHGNLFMSKEHIYPANDFFTSKVKPLVSLVGKPAMSGLEINGNLVYDVFLNIDDVSVSLRFVGTNQGWKGTVPVGEWIVAQPHATVTGTIRVGQNTQNVNGTGYHDHNTGLTLQTGLLYSGWYWGQIQTKNITVVWSTLLKTLPGSESLLVVNNGSSQFWSIPPDEITVHLAGFSLENGKMIPHEFFVRAETQNLSINVTMNVVSTHHVKVGTLNYWRFHMHCEGIVRIGVKVEQIDEVEIQEFIRF